MVKRPSISLAQDRESLPARTDAPTTMLVFVIAAAAAAAADTRGYRDSV